MNTSVFNHKYGHYSEAIGISDVRLIELNELIRAVLKDTEKKYITESQKTERFLSEGLSILEVAYVFHIYGRMRDLPEAINKESEKHKKLYDAISNSPFGEMLKGLTNDEGNISIVEVAQRKFDEIFDGIVKEYNKNMD